MHPRPNFDLAITSIGDGYTVRIQSAFGIGELPPQPFELKLDLSLLPHHRQDVAEWVRQAQITRLGSKNEDLRRAREFGTMLFKSMFSNEMLACFRESRLSIPSDERLRLRLRLPTLLATLPWELLYDPREEMFLGLASDLTIVRYPEMPTPVTPLHVDGALQVVAVLASPSDYPPIKLDKELKRIEEALKELIASNLVKLEVIRGSDTLGQLRARLRRPTHVLHILCHGDLDIDTREGVLIFEGIDSDSEPINAGLLRLQIQRMRGQTRLVVLNSCLGALSVGDNPLSSVGESLLRGGVPAVVAMQFEVAEETAAELSRVFYSELAMGSTVDIAITEARLNLAAKYPHRLDWAIPVLFLRSDDGVIFDSITPEINNHNDVMLIRGYLKIQSR